jgi:purine-nucleoside phosphorylase
VSLLQEVAEAVRAIESRTPLRPTIGLVLGSGLGAFAKTLERAVAIPYRQIPHFPASTAIGHAGELVVGTSHGVPVAVMAGRAHYYEGYRLPEVVFPVRVLGHLGVKTIILTNAAGSVNVQYKPGELMVIDDHINYMGGNPCIGPNEEQLGERFFDMSDAYDPRLREIAEKACWKAGVPVRHGV